MRAWRHNPWIAGVVLMVTALAPSSPWGSERAPCGPDEASSKSWANRSLRFAQRSFPSARPIGKAPQCFCLGGVPCERQRTPLQLKEWRAKRVPVTLEITPVVVHASAEYAAVQARRGPCARLRPAAEFRSGFYLRPFATQARAQAAAETLWRDPVVAASLAQHGRIYCRVWPGPETELFPSTRYVCSTGKWDRWRDPVPRVGLQESSCTSTLSYWTYVLPARLITDRIPGWQLARQRPEVTQYVAAGKDHLVELRPNPEFDRPGGGSDRKLRGFTMMVSRPGSLRSVAVHMVGEAFPEEVVQVELLSRPR